MKTVNKVIDLLEAFLNNENDIGVSELAKLTGLNASTANRICKTLVERGYLKQLGKRGKYNLGMKFFDFMVAAKRRLKMGELALPFMVKLSRKAGETVILDCLDGTQSVHIEMVPTDNLLRVVPEEGARLPLYCSGVGKAILANFTDKQLEEYQKSVTFKRYTPNTITDMNKLKEQLLTIKREGVAFDYEERSLNVRNVAAAIKGQDGNIMGAIGILGPKIRLTRARMRELTPLVKQYALEISRELGYQGE